MLYSGDTHGVYNDAHVRVLLITVVISTEQSSSVQTNGKLLTQKTVAVYSHSIRTRCDQRFRPHIYTVSQKTSHLWLAITLTHMNGFWYFFGRNVTDKIGNQKTLYYATSSNLCFCTTWQNAETRKSHISLNWIVLDTQCTCARSSWKKKLSSVMCLIASNICWGSKISH